MLNKYKRFRERQKEGKVAVKVDFQLLVTRISGLPRSLNEAQLTLQRGGHSTQLPSVTPNIGETLMSMSFACRQSPESNLKGPLSCSAQFSSSVKGVGLVLLFSGGHSSTCYANTPMLLDTNNSIFLPQL